LRPTLGIEMAPAAVAIASAVIAFLAVRTLWLLVNRRLLPSP